MLRVLVALSAWRLAASCRCDNEDLNKCKTSTKHQEPGDECGQVCVATHSWFHDEDPGCSGDHYVMEFETRAAIGFGGTGYTCCKDAVSEPGILAVVIIVPTVVFCGCLAVAGWFIYRHLQQQAAPGSKQAAPAVGAVPAVMTAAAVAVQPPPQAVPAQPAEVVGTPAEDPVAKLKKLKEMKDEGLINDKEYEEMRKSELDKMSPDRV